MNDLLKFYLPIYIIIYFLIIFIIPTYRIYKNTGINPITFGKNDNAHDYIGFIMKILMVILFITILIFSLGDELYNFTSPILFLESNVLKIIGLFIIHFTLIWICMAQYQMSSSWRIGIDKINKTELVTKGIFSISRNPIFFGMIVSVLGLFLILPNTISFFLLTTTYIIIQIQIRLEEEFLEKEHGQNYMNYKSKTRRLI